MADRRYRLATDAHRLVGEGCTSGATYLGGLMEHWLRTVQDVEFILLAPARREGDVSRPSWYADKRVRWVRPVVRADPTGSLKAQMWWQQRVIPSLLRRERPDVYFSPF